MALRIKSPVGAPTVARIDGEAQRPSPAYSPRSDDSASENLTAHRRTLALAMALALAIAAGHVALSFGHLPVYWGDSGRWLHEVDRFANGERAYRDFFWTFPPLSMWIVGGLARVIGSDLPQILTITACLCAMIAATWSRLAVPLFGERFALPAIAVVLPLGIAFATTQSAPLASGMYTPAAPVGFLCLLLLLVTAISLWRTPRPRSAILLGLFASLCVLAKHDFWLPAGVLLAAAPLITESERRRTYVLSWSTAALVLAAAMSFVVMQNGLGVLFGILTGFGHTQELGGRGIPTLETLTLETTTASLCLAVVAGAVILTRPDKRRRAWWVALFALSCAGLLMAVWLTQAFWIARFANAHNGDRLSEIADRFSTEHWSTLVLFKTLARLLRDQLTFHALPSLLPFGVLALVWRFGKRMSARSRSIALVLLLTAAALRLRRGMEFAEWTSILIELPIYAYVARAMLGDQLEEWSATGRIVLASLALLFAWQYTENGYGPLTRRGSREPVLTPRGTVRLSPNQANQYRKLKAVIDTLDPTGRRPVIAFGYSGGFNYFLGRPAPSPLTHGFRLSGLEDPNEAVRLVRTTSPPPVVIDNPGFNSRTPTVGFQMIHWQAQTRPNHYMRFDRRYFEQMISGCRERPSALRRLTLYDCPERDTLFGER